MTKMTAFFNLPTASNTRPRSKKEIAAVMETPPEDLVRMVTAGLYQGRFTSQVKEQFTPMVKAAFRKCS